MSLRTLRLWLIELFVRIELPLTKADIAAVDRDIGQILEQMRREQLLPTQAQPMLQRLRRRKLELGKRLVAYRALARP